MGSIMTGKTLKDVLDQVEARPGARRRIDADVARMERVLELRRLRSTRNLTQADLAQRMGLSQRRVSAIEHATETALKLDTLRRYVEGLGGTLEVAAVFGDERFNIPTG